MKRAIGIPPGVFAGRFGRSLTGERREADLFLADLMGQPQPAESFHEAEAELDAFFGAFGDAAALAAPARPVVGAPAAEDTSPAPANAMCARDVPVTDALALIVANNAPLPVTPAEVQRVASDAGARADYRAVAAVVPAAPDQRLLIFLHGNNNYVTVAPTGDVPVGVDPSHHSRAPRWAETAGRLAALRGRAAPIKYGYESLRSAQAALKPEASFTPYAVKNPIVLVPEDAEKTTGSFWSKPPAGQYGSANSGARGKSGTTKLQDMVIECYEHLRCLRNPAGRPYLSPEMAQRASWISNVQRVYLSGHSGGGKPLVEAAGADMMLISPTSVAGVGGRAADLWLFDCTYGFGTHNYVNFCATWNAAKLLGYAPNQSRLVCVYRPASKESDTETEADRLRGEIAGALGVSPDSLRKLHDSSNMASASMLKEVIPALTSSPVIFVRTNVAHDSIPGLFTPLLLRTAAS